MTKDPSVGIRTRNQVTVFTLSSMGLESHPGDQVFVRAVQLKMLIADQDGQVAERLLNLN